MLEKFNHLAEAAAANVSRRQVLGRFGRAAAAALAGLVPSQAHAGRGLGAGFCSECGYECPDGSTFVTSHKGNHCREKIDGCVLVYRATYRCGADN